MAKNGVNVYGTNSPAVRKLLEEAVAAAITNVPYVGDDRPSEVEFTPVPEKKPTVDETIQFFKTFMDERGLTNEEKYETTALLYLDVADPDGAPHE